MNRQLKTASLFLLLFVAIGFFSTTAHTQSGRRQNKPAPSAPVPTPTPEPTPQPKNEPKSDLSFIVGIDRSDSFTYYPLGFYTAVLRGCSDSLSRGSSAKVTTSQHLTRSEAIKKAKTEKTAYVVWMRLTSLAMATARQPNVNEEAEIEYVVYTPVTAKIATNGRAYQNASRKGPIVVQPPGGRGNVLYQEHMLKRAAEDVGDRILKALHIKSGSVYSANSSQPQRKAAR
jgi:hypothetical protein